MVGFQIFASMQREKSLQERARQEIVFVSALDLLTNSHSVNDSSLKRDSSYQCNSNNSSCQHNASLSLVAADYAAAISNLCFPFALKSDQIQAVEAWLANLCRGSVIYG